MNLIYRHGELKKPKAFTPYALCHNHLRYTGEGVKAKNENRLTRARTREGKREKSRGYRSPPCVPYFQNRSIYNLIHFDGR